MKAILIIFMTLIASANHGNHIDYLTNLITYVNNGSRIDYVQDTTYHYSNITH